MNTMKTYSSNIHQDERGKLYFFNDFNLNEVKRMYQIENKDTSIIRAWQAHKIDRKWFYVLEGAFELVLVKLDDFENPSKNLNVEKFIISSDEKKIIEVPGGFANGFRALQENSKILVFSDKTLEESKNDDFRFDKNLWYNW